MAKRRKGRRKARSAAQKRATAKMLRAAKAARRSKGRVAAPRKRRRKARKSHAAPKRRKARKARKAPKRRRKARRRAAEEWRGDSAGHARAARKGWRKRKAKRAGKRKAARKSAGRKRQTAKQRAASLRNLRKARAARRGHGKSKPRKRSATRRRARRAAGTAHRASRAITTHKGPGLSSYGRRRRAKRNPSQYGLTGGELFVASIFGTLGFLGGDALDRFIATHALTDKGTKDSNGNELYADNPPTSGNYSGLFNPTAICAPMDLGRWAAGIGVPAAMFVTANFVKAPMVRASMQFAAFGWGVRVVGKGAIDAIAMLTKGMGTGQRLYDGEMRAAVLKANNGNQQAAELASLPSAGLGRPQLGKPLGDCAPCEQKNLGYPSMPRETGGQSQTQAPTPQMTAPPPPPPPAAPPPNLNMQNLTGVPKNGARNRFNWGYNDE